MRRRDDPPLDDRLRQMARHEPAALDDIGDLDDDDVCIRLYHAVMKLSAAEARLVIPMLPPSMVDAFLLGAYLLGHLDEQRVERILDELHPERVALRNFARHLADPAAPAAPPDPPVRTDPITHRRPHSRREALRLVGEG